MCPQTALRLRNSFPQTGHASTAATTGDELALPLLFAAAAAEDGPAAPP
jgi:hypothetical protein